jgi:hypothetical protein
MGYTTDFFGSFQLDKPLSIAQRDYLTMFSETRRMKRDASKIPTLTGKTKGRIFNDSTDDAKNVHCLDLLAKVGLDVGPEGAYYCGTGSYGQGEDSSVVDYNWPPTGQPGLWCQWVPTEDGTGIEWNGSEKFYEYVKWLEYIINHFLKPWGLTLNGEVEWQGEEREDRGMIIVKDNVVTTKKAKVTWE